MFIIINNLNINNDINNNNINPIIISGIVKTLTFLSSE